MRWFVLDGSGAPVPAARVGGGLSLTAVDATGHFTLRDVPVGHREIVAVSDALDDLDAANPEAAAVVRLRFFGGLTGREAAAAMGVSPRKADQLWAYARAWLLDKLADGPT